MAAMEVFGATLCGSLSGSALQQGRKFRHPVSAQNLSSLQALVHRKVSQGRSSPQFAAWKAASKRHGPCIQAAMSNSSTGDSIPEVEGNEIVIDVSKYVQALKEEQAGDDRPKLAIFDHDIYNAALIEQLQVYPDKEVIVPVVRRWSLSKNISKVLSWGPALAKGAVLAVAFTSLARLFAPAAIKGLVGGGMKAAPATASMNAIQKVGSAGAVKLGRTRTYPPTPGQLSAAQQAAIAAVSSALAGVALLEGPKAVDSLMKFRTIFKVQLAMRGPVRLIRQDLERVGMTYNLSEEDGMRIALWEGVYSLMRTQWLCSHFSSQVMTTAGEEQYWDKLNRTCLEEEMRGVTRMPLQGQVCRLDSWGNEPESEFMVVTIIAAMEGRVNIPEVRSWNELEVALHKLCRMSNDRIKHLDILWVPKKDSEPYTEEEMLGDFPNLKPLVDYVNDTGRLQESELTH